LPAIAATLQGPTRCRSSTALLAIAATLRGPARCCSSVARTLQVAARCRLAPQQRCELQHSRPSLQRCEELQCSTAARHRRSGGWALHVRRKSDFHRTSTGLQPNFRRMYVDELSSVELSSTDFRPTFVKRTSTNFRPLNFRPQTSVQLSSDFRPRTFVRLTSVHRLPSVELPSTDFRPRTFVRQTSVLRTAYVIADVTASVLILLSYTLMSYHLAPCCPTGLMYCRPTSYSPTFYALWSCILWTCVLQLILLHSAVVLSCD
jgi:hypothetical protein